MYLEKQQTDLISVYDIIIKTISHIKIHPRNRRSSNGISFICRTIENIPAIQ